jgi:3-oxoacyl-[acyl-carrier protein] reductase
MVIRFDNKRVLITGGTRGIGYEVATSFTSLGANVVVTGTSKHRPLHLDSKIAYEQLFISQKTNWHRQIEDIINKYDGFDILINNAGINKVNPIYKTEQDDLDNILLTNLNAPIYITSKISEKMISQNGGYIINIGSIFGVVSRHGRNPYTASKSGLIGVTKTMAIDLAKYNIFVNCISPGFVETELTKKVLGEKGIKEVSLKIPMQRLAKVADIAPTILFLCSNYNTYITGQNILIDGGFVLE